MKKMKHTIVGRASFVFLLIFVLTSCDLFKLDINTDPSNPATATPDLVLPNAMVVASTNFGGAFNRSIHGFMGMMSVSDDFNLNSGSFSATWQNLYQGPLKDIDATIKYSTKVGTLPGYLGMAQVMKALYFSYIVDLWGDVPYFTAFNGDNAAAPETSPKYDKARDIYSDLFTTLDAAIVNLNTASAVSYAAGDPIYGGNRAQWIKAANSLKLKLYVQIRNVKSQFPELGDINAKTAALLTGPLITVAADDMDFRFNAAQTPDYRHPWFQTASTGATNAFSYISHQLMYEMLVNKDPRWPFYFKRETNTTLNLTDATERGTAPCSSISGCVYGYMVANNGSMDVLANLKAAGVITSGATTGSTVGTPTAATLNATDKDFLAGIFGRDRADNSGAPNDAPLRTSIGCYPAGGYYDDNFSNNPVTAPVTATVRKPVSNGGNGGGAGNGLFPMLSTSLVKFYIAEAMLTGMVTSVTPEVVFENAVREHIDRVSNQSLKVDTKAIAVTNAARDAYVAGRKAAFVAAASNDLKLDVVWKQGWYSAWGNAIDVYNAFRRTGKPTGLQIPLNKIRQFALSLPYVIDELTLNKNAPQNAPQFDTPEAALFWDVLKFKF